MVASVIAAWGAPVLVCGTCCDCDCCGALGWSCAKSVTPGIRNSGTDIVAMARVIMGVNVDGCCGSGQLTALFMLLGSEIVTRDYFYSMCASILGPPVLKNRTRRTAATTRKIIFRTVV